LRKRVGGRRFDRKLDQILFTMYILIRPILLFAFILILFNAHSQFNGIVKDSVTQQPVPFVNIWIDGETIGTTSNENGEYLFKQDIIGKRIVLSSIGYKKKTIVVISEEQVILLQPEAVHLREVIVKAKRKGKPKRNTIGEDFKVSNVRRFFFCGESPYIAAKYFPYQDDYSKTPYLAGFEIVTSSPLDSATFNIRLYSVNEKGEPDQPLYADNIMSVARKGINLTTVVLTDQIEFPVNGLFVAFEFLIIESNKYTFTIPGTVEKKETAYMPALGTIPTEEEGKSRIYNGGTWQKTKRNKGAPQEEYEGRFSDVAIRVVLTD
jgi:hypothetical protein